MEPQEYYKKQLEAMDRQNGISIPSSASFDPLMPKAHEYKEDVDQRHLQSWIRRDGIGLL